MNNKIHHTSSRRRTTALSLSVFFDYIHRFHLFDAAGLVGRQNLYKSACAGFTAVSATCVTGLVTLRHGRALEHLRQIVILIMIQTGGLGFMTVVVALDTGRACGHAQGTYAAGGMSFNIGSYDKLGEILRRITIGTICIELAGAAVLSTRFIPLFGFWDAYIKAFSFCVGLLHAGLTCSAYTADSCVAC